MWRLAAQCDSVICLIGVLHVKLLTSEPYHVGVIVQAGGMLKILELTKTCAQHAEYVRLGCIIDLQVTWASRRMGAGRSRRLAAAEPAGASPER